MKTCPTCQRTYPDDNQSNCAYDGAQLSAPYPAPPGQNPQQQYTPQPGQYQQYAPPPGQYQPQQYAPPPGVNPMPPPPGYPPPGGWQGVQPPPYQAGTGEYVPCPQCRMPDPEKVGFTWWGGLIGPRLLKHVKCRTCGTAYNGKTGKSNTTGIVIYSVVLFVIAFAVVLIIVMAK